MPIIIGIFCLLPLLVGAAAEYLCCRIPVRRGWRALPPAAAILLTAVIAAGRWNIWRSETVSPVTQLLLFPGLPGVCLLLGCWLGWREWKRLWTPHVIRDEKKEKR